MTLLKRLATATAALALSAGAAMAQAYPNKPITFIVPFAAGGPTDIITRLVAEHMAKTLGQPVIVENVAGAGGTTGITRGATATPDGYTIMMGHMGTHGAAPALYNNIKYDPRSSFQPIGLAAGTPVLLVAKKSATFNDVKGFVEFAKANEKTINQGHAGVGSVSFTSCSLVNSEIGIKPTAIPYRGTGPAMQDLIGEKFDYMCDQVVAVVSQVNAGTIKALAIGSDTRSPVLPNVPTMKEAGFPAMGVSAWNAIFAPKGIPADALAKLTDALDKALDDEGTRKRLLDLGSVLPDKQGRTPAALQKLVESEVARWSDALKKAGIVAAEAK
jgi:tripartite-type tricarboxylate transporter receptor subunit TctC